MERVTGITREALEAAWLDSPIRSSRERRLLEIAIGPWAEIERGSNLFAAGSFNTKHVHEQALSFVLSRGPLPLRANVVLEGGCINKTPVTGNGRCECGELECSHTRAPSLSAMVITPAMLQAVAYFPDVFSDGSEAVQRCLVRILLREPTHPPRQHLLRYRLWWDHAERSNRVDELESFYEQHEAGILAQRTEGPGIAYAVTVQLAQERRARIDSLATRATQKELGIGAKTALALRECGCETVSDLAALTAADAQQAVLAAVPRTIASQLRRRGGLDALAADAARMQSVREGERAREDETHVALRQRIDQEHALRWPDNGAALEPPVLLGQLRRLLEAMGLEAPVSDVQFEHLNASLANGKVDDDGLQLRVVRSSSALREAARALRNCALDYEQSIRSRQYVMVALVRVCDETPVALGGYDGSQRWAQVVEMCNKRATGKTLARFNEYLPTLRSFYNTYLRAQPLALDVSARLPEEAQTADEYKYASLEGKRVVFSGTLQMRRAEAKTLAEAAGASVSSSGTVSRYCDILVTGVRPAAGKVEAARNLGADVWSEERFISVLRELQQDEAQQEQA